MSVRLIACCMPYFSHIMVLVFTTLCLLDYLCVACLGCECRLYCIRIVWIAFTYRECFTKLGRVMLYLCCMLSVLSLSMCTYVNITWYYLIRLHLGMYDAFTCIWHLLCIRYRFSERPYDSSGAVELDIQHGMCIKIDGAQYAECNLSRCVWVVFGLYVDVFS